MTTIDIGTLTLARGGHGCDDPEMCFFEAYNLAHRDVKTEECPPDVSPVLHVYGMRLNDTLPDSRRQELIPLIPLLPGTAGDGLDGARSYMALDWLVRVYTPAWLGLAGLSAEADGLRSLRRIVDLASADAAVPAVRAAAKKAAAARDAAGDTDWTAARTAARTAAGDAARAVAGAVAGDAAGDAARTAAGTAAGDALQPTVELLQTSAIELFRAMVRPGARP